MTENFRVELLDFEPMSPSFLKEVLTGLSKTQKSLPPKLLYDKRGSELFEKICLLKEYYPTRAESEILKTYASEIASLIGEEAIIIEPGSGAGDKIRFLLPYLSRLKAYVPIEISRDILVRMTQELRYEFSHLKVVPFVADFFQDIDLPNSIQVEQNRKIIFFPGSTIGNLEPAEAVQFLKRYGKLIGRGGGLVIGVDLKKDPEVILKAYDDPYGVTAEFNLNLLERINREAFANFNIKNFQHIAIYNEKKGKVEMHIMSRISQFVKVNGSVFRFLEGESIHTENSYKYSVEEFCDLAVKAHFSLKKFWKDRQELFCVYYFERVPS